MPKDITYQGNSVIIRSPNTGGAAANQSTSRKPATALEVFLSSTIGDLGKYRKGVEAALRKAKVSCFLSEDWINTFGATVEKCKERLDEANAFIGIFGYWYGSIPNGYKQSITHLEFTWALKKWANENPPPIAILMPKTPSAVAKKLTASAASLIPTSQLTVEQHSALLKAFHDEVTGSWKTVTWFESMRDLRENVIVIGMELKGGRPIDAARGKVEVVDLPAPARPVTDEEWGLLGRAEHLEVFDKVLNRVALHSEVPAVAQLVHGDEDSGQRVFLRRLLTNKKMHSGRPIQIGRPQVEQYELKALTQWVGESVGVLGNGKEVASPAELAELIHAELQQHQIGFILDEAYRLSGGLMTWYKEFWNPLYSRLSELRKQTAAQTQHRLIAIVVDYDDQSGLDKTTISNFSGATTAEDYARMWLLPMLDDFDEGDLADWFDALEVPDDAGRRGKLVNIALNKVKGRLDGTPLRVFDRLKNSSLW
jgi:hypothetical protein